MAEPAHLNVTPLDVVKPHPTYIAVSPEIARKWLDRNAVNRSLRQGKVEQYARDMAAGRWTLGESAICFGVDGHLLNGQHRLHAVIKANVTVIFLVIRNMPVEAMPNMDIGTARTAGDVLHFEGEHNTHALAAVTKQCLLYTDGRIYKDNRSQVCSPSELSGFLAEHPEIRHSVKTSLAARKSLDAPPSAIGAAHWIIAGVNGTPLADLYVNQLSTRVGEPEGSPILAVDSRLRELRRYRSKLPGRDYIYLLIKGWNHYAKGSSVRVISASPRSEFRIPTPVRWTR